MEALWKEALFQGETKVMGTIAGRLYDKEAVWQGISKGFFIRIVGHNAPILIRYLGTFCQALHYGGDALLTI